MRREKQKWGSQDCRITSFSLRLFFFFLLLSLFFFSRRVCRMGGLPTSADSVSPFLSASSFFVTYFTRREMWNHNWTAAVMPRFWTSPESFPGWIDMVMYSRPLPCSRNAFLLFRFFSRVRHLRQSLDDIRDCGADFRSWKCWAGSDGWAGAGSLQGRSTFFCEAFRAPLGILSGSGRTFWKRASAVIYFSWPLRNVCEGTVK